MDLCSENHGEVCHDARLCPACEAIDELQGRLDDMTSERDDLQKEVDAYEAAP